MSSVPVTFRTLRFTTLGDAPAGEVRVNPSAVAYVDRFDGATRLMFSGGAWLKVEGELEEVCERLWPELGAASRDQRTFERLLTTVGAPTEEEK